MPRDHPLQNLAPSRDARGNVFIAIASSPGYSNRLKGHDLITPKSRAYDKEWKNRNPRDLGQSERTARDLHSLAEDYQDDRPAFAMASATRDRLNTQTIQQIFTSGLHEFIQDFIRDNNALGACIEKDYRFNG